MQLFEIFPSVPGELVPGPSSIAIRLPWKRVSSDGNITRTLGPTLFNNETSSVHFAGEHSRFILDELLGCTVANRHSCFQRLRHQEVTKSMRCRLGP